MSNLKFILVCSLWIVIVCSSCKKVNVEEGIHTYAFSNADKKWFFYNVGDSLHYKNNANEKLTYVVTETKEIICPGYATTYRDLENALSYYESHYFITLKATNASAFGEIEIEAVKKIPNSTQRANPPRVEGTFWVIAKWNNLNNPNYNRSILINTNQLNYEEIILPFGTLYAAVNVCDNYNVHVIGYKPIIKTYYSPTNGFVRFTTFDGKVWDSVF